MSEAGAASSRQSARSQFQAAHAAARPGQEGLVGVEHHAVARVAEAAEEPRARRRSASASSAAAPRRRGRRARPRRSARGAAPRTDDRTPVAVRVDALDGRGEPHAIAEAARERVHVRPAAARDRAPRQLLGAGGTRGCGRRRRACAPRSADPPPKGADQSALAVGSSQWRDELGAVAAALEELADGEVGSGGTRGAPGRRRVEPGASPRGRTGRGRGRARRRTGAAGSPAARSTARGSAQRVLEPAPAAADRERHVARRRRDAELAEEAGRSRVRRLVEDEEAGVEPEGPAADGRRRACGRGRRGGSSASKSTTSCRAARRRAAASPETPAPTTAMRTASGRRASAHGDAASADQERPSSRIVCGGRFRSHTRRTNESSLQDGVGEVDLATGRSPAARRRGKRWWLLCQPSPNV